MNGGRWPLEPPAAKPRTSRLSRSFRQTQAAEVEAPQTQQSGFKTPTRIHRSRPAAVCGESPQNDSDIQQDIIWDATSPSPHRLTGRRGRKHAAGVVNISEIVSRIAPKHGRPKAAEPTLQQWIRDSASIPCTPDVQAPKPKKKSPRLNRVDDLLKLAKQFDFKLFRQDVEDVEDLHQQSLELLTQGVLNFENSIHAEGPHSQLANDNLDPNMDNDLDFLFDGPTQHTSRNLSQASSAQLSQVKPVAGDSGRAPASQCGPSVEFEDDWENDDLLNDSLMLEMTQNPLTFTAPKFCSTQRAANQVRDHQTVRAAVSQSVGSTVDKENVTFRLDQNAEFSVRRVQTDTSSGGPQRPCQNRPITVQTDTSSGGPQRPCQNRPITVQAQSTSSGGPQQPNPVRTAPQDPQKTAQCFVPPVLDFLDDDLDSFFSSEPVWDDPADDDLLCEMCEDLEKQIQVSDHRAALQPASMHPSAPVGSGRPGGASLACGPGSSTANMSFRLTQTVPGSTVRPACLQGSSNKDRFTFKKPNSPVSMAAKHPITTATSEAVGKCSAAEIQLKKQQAMERRRQRLQAAQNLRALP
ncbi:ewing's tumor-associated antigen 1 isoform X2 [Parambassis ranga]|uniref:Ewing's tumor-associated antigen 1 isoform X2 n=1 Tax=Parambassis ranga TaxID=210632 RepID=A0A6P7ISI6_9TELE|nr:uncharacterized protein LOC114437415 isoform X2 [Parambassis ranga]